MCKHGTTVEVTVTIPADLSCTGAARKKTCAIDACIAPLVAALEAGGVLMRGSCCGHGARAGEILLADGRALIVEHGGLTVRHLSHGLVADGGLVCSPPRMDYGDHDASSPVSTAQTTKEPANDGR